MDFRKDINGLRAFAVISVVIFHYNNALITGGFVGVDIFFVISGFLMTKIILTKLSDDSFKLSGFYYSRAKRIIPSLVAVCIACVVIGFLFLSPKDYYSLSIDALSSILFVSNFWYASQSGYFDTSSTDNVLLHTWSLSVEWQFYIIYPILLLAIYRALGKRSATRSIYLLFVVSFISGLLFTFRDPANAYYMFPLRAWEMIIGGICFINQGKITGDKYKKTIELFGFLLIFYSLFFVNKDVAWPGYAALIPTFGSAMILMASNQNSIFTSGKIQQFLGKISYSTYLVHWPILVFMWKMNLSLSITSYLLLTILISYLFFNLFERERSISKKSVAMYCFCFAFCYMIFNNNGYETRVPEEFRLTPSEFHKKYYGGSSVASNKIVYENSDKINYQYIFAGDSFAAQYAKSIKESGLKSAEIYSHGCPMFPDYSRYLRNQEFKECTESFNMLKSLLDNNKTATLIYSLSWDTYNDSLIAKGDSSKLSLSDDEYKKLIKSQIQKVIEIGGNERKYIFVGRPQKTNLSGFDCLAGTSLIGYKLISSCSETVKQQYPEINKVIEDSIDGIKNAYFFDPNKSLCNDGKCIVINKNQPVYTDGAHLSVYGSKIVFSDIKNIL